MDPTSAQLEHAIKRNFGGSEKVQTYEIFKKKLPSLRAVSRQADDIDEEVRRERKRERERETNYRVFLLSPATSHPVS